MRNDQQDIQTLSDAEATGVSGEEATAVKPRARGPGRFFAWAAVGVAILVAFALRTYRLDVSSDIFVDEITYLHLSQSVLQTFWVARDGSPFYLHPPGLFFVEAAYLKLFGGGGDLIDRIYDVRYLTVAMAGVSAGAMLWLGRRLAGWWAGFAAAAIFAYEPYIIKMNSRNLIDTPTMMWVLLGYCVLLSALAIGTGDNEKRFWIPDWRVITAGVLFGLALLNKEESAFVTLLPLGICFVLGWAIPRLQSFVAGLIAVIVYLPYPTIVWLRGDWGDFIFQKTQGASRLAGLFHETGFNQQGGPSFIAAILKNLGEFATTYTLLGSGGISVLIIFFLSTWTPARRLFLAWAASAYFFLAYIVALGALEEQFFLYLIIPAILTTVVAADLLLRRTSATGRFYRPLVTATIVLAVAFFGWSGYQYVQIHTVPDNGYERVISYLQREVPEDRSIATTSDTGYYLIKDHAGPAPYTSIETLQKDNVDYVVVSSYLATEGYKEPPPEVYDWIKNKGDLVYIFHGRSSGRLGVWQLPESATR